MINYLTLLVLLTGIIVCGLLVTDAQINDHWVDDAVNEYDVFHINLNLYEIPTCGTDATIQGFDQNCARHPLCNLALTDPTQGNGYGAV